MKSFISAAILAAVVAAEDPLMDKLNDLKAAFAQLADAPRPTLQQRKGQNLAQIDSSIETTVIAEAISEVVAEAEVEVEAEVQAGDSDETNTIINVFNGEVENRRRPW